jgi:hypothetical protein
MSHVNAAERAIIMLALGAIMTAASLYLFAVGVADFSTFYYSGAEWLAGRSPYVREGFHPNLNPPLLIAAVFAPLARLPYPTAKVVWVVVGALGLAASFRVITRELSIAPVKVVWLVGIFLLTSASAYVWMAGQVTWLLMYPGTRSWAAYRKGRWTAASVWLAPLIVAKPILIVFALLLPWRVWLVSGLASAGLTAAGVLWTGWTPWLTWLRVSSDVTWLANPANMSLWGLASRLQTGDRLGGGIADLHPLVIVLVLVIMPVAALLVLRERDADRRMVRAMLVTLLIAPLGWVYYVPLCAGPAIASWPRNRWAVACLVALCVPLPFLQPIWDKSPGVIRSLGSVYALALILAWVAWSKRSD